jgi:predicted ATP-dependent serine protease
VPLPSSIIGAHEGNDVVEDLAGHRRTRTQTVSQVLSELDGLLRSGDRTELRAVRTGFSILDDILGGGLRVGELVLLGGPPGVGKTIAALQWAREIAKAGGRPSSPATSTSR